MHHSAATTGEIKQGAAASRPPLGAVWKTRLFALRAQSTKRVEVGKVLGPSHGAFVLDEQVLAKNKHGEPRKLGWYFRGESFPSGDSGYSRQQIDSVRDAAKLKHLIGLKKVGRFEPALRKTKVA
jgi:hypothetical protein